MKQLIVKAITYTGKYASQHKDGSTMWAQVSLWISDRFGLTVPKAARAWIIADRLAQFDHTQAGVVNISEGVYSWAATTDLVTMFQEIINEDGPVTWERIKFDQQMLLVKRDDQRIVPVLDDRNCPILADSTEISYLANSAGSWNREDSYYREMLSWIPNNINQVFAPIAGNNTNTENPSTENGTTEDNPLEL